MFDSSDEFTETEAEQENTPTPTTTHLSLEDMEKLQAISQQPGVIMQCGQCYAFENLMENNFTEEMDEYFNRNNTNGYLLRKV